MRTEREAEGNCIFCKLLRGEAPVTFVHRDDQCVAFMDIQPVNTGHMLVIPIRHAPYLADIEADEAAQLMRVAHTLAGALRRSGLRCEGVNLFLADGEAAMQEVFHVHVHVFPRFEGDGFGLKFDPGYYTKKGRGDLEHAASLIRSAM